MASYFERFECALTTDKHFCRYEIVMLPCCHVACQNCLPSFMGSKILKVNDRKL